MPIINPWFFYFAGAVDTLDAFLAIFVTVMIIVIVALIMIFSIEYPILFNEDDDETKKFWRLIKKLSVFTVICALLVIVIPDKETLYRMMISKYITTDTIDEGVDEAKELIDYFIEKTNEVDEADEK